MDNSTQILLNSKKNISSVNVDTFQKFELKNKSSLMLEYDIENALSATEIFDAEREANEIYRIYGKIEYLSLLNGLSLNYTGLSYFFLSQKTNIKTIYNSFDFYLVKPSTGYTNITGITSTIEYVRYFEVIATPSDFELFDAGFNKNVYGEQTYVFNFNKDFDVSTYVDNFGFPATELFLYAVYKPQVSAIVAPETLSGTSWGTNGVKHKVLINTVSYNIGDRIYGDLIEYSKELFLQNQLSEQTYYISTAYTDLGSTKFLQWKYNPFISLRLRYFSDDLNRANSGTTSYEQQVSIPYYATPVGYGNYVWKDILPQGFIDPLTNLGVDYPFINKKRYLFSPIILDVIPDFNNANTLQVFTEIKFGVPIPLNTSPLGDITNIGKPCQ